MFKFYSTLLILTSDLVLSYSVTFIPITAMIILDLILY